MSNAIHERETEIRKAHFPTNPEFVFFGLVGKYKETNKRD